MTAIVDGVEHSVMGKLSLSQLLSLAVGIYLINSLVSKSICTLAPLFRRLVAWHFVSVPEDC